MMIDIVVDSIFYFERRFKSNVIYVMVQSIFKDRWDITTDHRHTLWLVI